MLYIAKETSKTQPATLAFKDRGLTLTQARISDVVITGKARQVQIAHSGYKESIEAFLFATATVKKCLTDGSVYTIPDSYVPTVPLAMPQVIFRPAKKLTEAHLKVLSEKLESQGLQRVDVGKGEPSYTLAAPLYKTIAFALPPMCAASAAFIDSHAQMEAAVLACRLYQCVDLFLATNTYYFKPSDFVGEHAGAGQTGIAARSEGRVNAYWYREGVDEENASPHKSRKGDDGKAIKTDVALGEPIDLTPDRVGYVCLQDIVHVAKPSPLPSSTNWGPPQAVPFVSGLLFPFFPGMLVPDAAGLRELSLQFLRNMGDSKMLPKDAFVAFRKVSGTYASTPQGIIMCHVLKGVELALQCQSVLYLLFDGGKYMGFTLLGTEFDVFLHGKWHSPLSASELRSELRGLRTHDQSLADLSKRLESCAYRNGYVPMTPIKIVTCGDIGDLLSKLDLDAKDHDADEEELSEILSRINFSTLPMTFKPANIALSLQYLTGAVPFPEDAYFHIPLKNWDNLGTLEYRVFAQYGPRGFSLRNVKGTEMLIPKDLKDKNLFEEKDEKNAFVYPKFIVGEKVISQCMTDWEGLREKRSMKMDFVERAAGSRNHIFPRDQFKTIWDALVQGVVNGVIGTKPVAADKKRPHAVAFGEGSFNPDLF